jgi:soluble lytic murein transglycosylase-like protein
MLRALVCCLLAGLVAVLAMVLVQPARAADAGLDALIAQHANANGVPVALVRRVIQRESGNDPRMVYHGNYGLMQIRLGTARALGYRGAPAGLLDPETNMTYAVRYLAGAYRAAHGNELRAVALYTRGY